jgi:MFS family permease
MLAANIYKYYLYLAARDSATWMQAAIYVVYLQQHRGLTLTQIALIDTFWWLTSSLSEIPTGVVADRFSRKLSLAVGAFLAGCGALLYGLAPTFTLFLVANGLAAVALTFGSGADEALLYESLQCLGRAEEYPKITGRARALARGMVAVGSISGGLLAASNFLYPFLCAALLYFVAFSLALLLREPTHSAATAQQRQGYGVIVRTALQVIRQQPTLRFTLLYLALVPVAAAVTNLLFLQTQALALGVPVALIGVIVMGANGANLVGSLLAHHVAGVLGERRMVYGGPFVLLICLVLMGVSQTHVTLLLMIFLGLVSAALHPLLYSRLQCEVSDQIRATILSMQSLLFLLCLAVIEPLLGATADQAGLSSAYYLLAGLLGVVCILLYGQRSLFASPAKSR